MGETGNDQSRAVVPVKSIMPAENCGYMKSLISRIAHIWPLKYVVKILKQIAVFTGLLEEVENIGTAEQISPSKRRFVSGKKRIGRLTRLILLVTPYRIQYALGYRAEESIGKTTVDDIRKSPLKPCGKGSKRKQDDLDMEEQLSWVAALASEDLPYEDQDDDPTYEPSISESDSEENKSKNDTESDLEVEEKNGFMMLKEAAQPSISESHGEENKPKTNTEIDLEVEEKNVVLKETTREDTQTNGEQLDASDSKEPDGQEPNMDREGHKDSVPTD
ncbi:uncharacterized protein [Ranitomeya imitator]|uniref:uncharacterized protein n=1 Tax=Ranitomeya imitator TaxID=111125 RepID=UPI0037E6FA83